jgi:hypothetical protein
MTVQLPLAEHLPLDRAEILAMWHERAGELEHSGWPKGRAELKAFYELGDQIRSQTTPRGLGARRCAWCGNRCDHPMPARRGLAGVVVCNGDCYSEFWIDRRTRIDARLYAIGCKPEPTKEDLAAIDQAIDELKAV